MDYNQNHLDIKEFAATEVNSGAAFFMNENGFGRLLGDGARWNEGLA